MWMWVLYVCVCGGGGGSFDNLPMVALGNIFRLQIVDLKRLVGLIISQSSQ